MVTHKFGNHERVWKAISDGKRRVIIDALFDGPKSTGELVELFPTIGRTAVLKHLDILEDTNLIIIKRKGRMRWNHLNSEPIKEACGTWMLKHIEGIKSSASRLKAIAEED